MYDQFGGGGGTDPSLFLMTGYLSGAAVAMIGGALLLGVFTLPAFFAVIYSLTHMMHRVITSGGLGYARALAEFAGVAILFSPIVLMFVSGANPKAGPMANGIATVNTCVSAWGGVAVVGLVMLIFSQFDPLLLVLKVTQILFRGLLRSPLRSSLSYLALFVLTLVLTFIYTIITFIGAATSEKENNFKVIMTEKYSAPSQMPPGYEDRLAAMLKDLPPDLRPVNGNDDVMAWSFVGGTTDPTNPKPENAIFMFCVDPTKITKMMDGLEAKDLTPEELKTVEDLTAKMAEDYKRIILSPTRLKKMNVQVGQKIKVSSSFYKDIVFDFEIIGTLPDGKFEGVGFCSREYLDKMMKSYSNSHNGERHPLADKCMNLLWVRVPNRKAYEQLAAAVGDPKNFSGPAVKMETASATIGSILETYKDIFFGMKYILSPAMVAIMSLVIANAISISVRERRGEMAVLKVLGFRPWHVLGLVLGEALLVGGMAGFMSTFLAWLMLGNFKFQIAFLGAFFVPKEVLVGGPLLGMAVAFVGSLGPALSAKNVKVSDVFSKVA